MNKKINPDYKRKDLMLHKDVIKKFKAIAKKQSKSVKKAMEDVLTDYLA